jgi:hypothetical protein
VTNHDTLQTLEDYNLLKQAIEEIENQAEDREQYKRIYAELIKKFEILTYYSKIILNMYLSVKVLSKVMNEVTYSWRMYKEILKQILQAAIREMVEDALKPGKKGAGENQPAARRPQVDIDLKFFQLKLIPRLHRTLMTSVRQESSAPLFNLIFALRVGMQQERISLKEYQFFFKWLLKLNDFQDWRKTEVDFVDMGSEIERQRLNGLRRDLSNLYKEDGKAFLERVESELGASYVYKDASMFTFRAFKEQPYREMTIMQKICLGFLCPDHEFKARLTKFVYETLSEVFDFTEEYSRLHEMLSLAAWRQPIALLSAGHINIINTISSIAQHYGVGLDVIRMDQDSDRLMVESKQGVNVAADRLVRENLIDYAGAAMDTREQMYAKL